MNLQRLCEEIRLPEEAMKVLETYRTMDDGAYADYKRAFRNNRFAFLEEIKRVPQYRALGIEDDVYFDTFSDIRIR